MTACAALKEQIIKSAVKAAQFERMIRRELKYVQDSLSDCHRKRAEACENLQNALFYYFSPQLFRSIVGSESLEQSLGVQYPGISSTEFTSKFDYFARDNWKNYVVEAFENLHLDHRTMIIRRYSVFPELLKEDSFCGGLSLGRGRNPRLNLHKSQYDKLMENKDDVGEDAILKTQAMRISLQLNHETLYRVNPEPVVS